MKIALLVLHIVCAILFGICAVISTNMISEIGHIIASIAWSVCVGMDIVQLIYERN